MIYWHGWQPIGDKLYSSHEPTELTQWLCYDDSTINVVLIITALSFPATMKSLFQAMWLFWHPTISKHRWHYIYIHNKNKWRKNHAAVNDKTKCFPERVQQQTECQYQQYLFRCSLFNANFRPNLKGHFRNTQSGHASRVLTYNKLKFIKCRKTEGDMEKSTSFNSTTGCFMQYKCIQIFPWCFITIAP